MQPEPILHMALAGPLRNLFDYLPPAGGTAAPAIGTRFLVPFGRGDRVAVLMGISTVSEMPRERLKRATRQLDDGALLGESDLRLLHWASDYYQHPLGDVIFQALPVNLRKPRSIAQVSPSGVRQHRHRDTQAGAQTAGGHRAPFGLTRRHTEGGAKSTDRRLRRRGTRTLCTRLDRTLSM